MLYHALSYPIYHITCKCHNILNGFKNSTKYSIGEAVYAYSILLNSSALLLLQRILLLQQPQLFISMAGFTDLAANTYAEENI